MPAGSSFLQVKELSVQCALRREIADGSAVMSAGHCNIDALGIAVKAGSHLSAGVPCKEQDMTPEAG